MLRDSKARPGARNRPAVSGLFGRPVPRTVAQVGDLWAREALTHSEADKWVRLIRASDRRGRRARPVHRAGEVIEVAYVRL